MPGGKTHSLMTLTTTGVVAVSMWQTGFTPEEICLAAAGCITGLVLGPDLDVDAGFVGHGIVDRYFGRIIGRAWRILWFPYAKIMPHRSNWSHAPVISTLVRLLYCYCIYFLAVFVVGKSPWIPPVQTALYYTLGLVVVDTLHFTADVISTYLKRRRYARIPLPLRRMQARRRTYARLQRAAPEKTQRLRR